MSEADRKSPGRRRLQRLIAMAVVIVAVTWGLHQALIRPNSLVPAQWNPLRPLRVSDPLTVLSSWKLGRAIEDRDLCHDVLAAAARVTFLSAVHRSPQCHISNRVEVAGVGAANVGPVETSCAIALRLAMWERHSLQPAAQAHLGTAVTAIAEAGSYNCRTMRTGRAASTRMSTHATAEAIDIVGFSLADGGQVTLLADWQGPSARADFLRAIMRGSCRWFRTVLSPDYNALHRDHFHLQSRGWGTCR